MAYGFFFRQNVPKKTVLGYKCGSPHQTMKSILFVEVNICKPIVGGRGDVNLDIAHQCTSYGRFQGG